jgi:hypothetical protein
MNAFRQVEDLSTGAPNCSAARLILPAATSVRAAPMIGR